MDNIKYNYQHHNATLKLNAAIQELKLVEPTGTVSIKFRTPQKSEVQEEVEKSQSSPGNKEGNADLVIKSTEAGTKRGSEDVAPSKFNQRSSSPTRSVLSTRSENSLKHLFQRCKDGIKKAEFQLNQIPNEHGLATTMQEYLKGRLSTLNVNIKKPRWNWRHERRLRQ